MKLENNQLISYSALAFCLSFIGLPIYIYLPNYYADNFSISLQTIAIILLFTRLFDTIQDPIIGIMSDKFFHVKRQIISYFSPLLGLSFLLLFYPLDIINVTTWLSIFLIITYTLFSIIYINYQSYAVSFSTDYYVKTKINSYREFTFILGIIFAVITPELLSTYFSQSKSFLFIGVGYVLLISFLAIIFYNNAPQQNHISEPLNQCNISMIFGKPIFKKYFMMFGFNALSSSIPAVLILFFVEQVLEARDLVGIFLLLYFVGLLLGVVLWTQISKLLQDKIKTFLISIVFTIFIFSWCYFLEAGDVMLYGLICFLSGIGFGGDFVLSYSILTDLVQKYKLQHYKTTIFGITNFIIKLSLTLSSASLIYIIGTIEDNAELTQDFIAFSYALLPIIFRIYAAFLLYKNFKK